MADALAAAPASAAEPFSIRGFAARMRSVDAAKCNPFGGGCRRDGEEEPPPLPPMEPPPRSRWWAHELAAARARLSACAKKGREAAAAGGGAVPRKGTKRKGSRSSAAADRAKKRRRVLQFKSLLRNKEKTSKTQSTYRLHQHLLHKGLSRKQISSIYSRRELALRKKLEEARDQILPHENSATHVIRERMDPSNDMHSIPFSMQEANSLVNEQSINVSGSINYPVNGSCEVMRHAAGPKDDIFGDLPLLESSKVIFQTGTDELPIVIEESFITDQSDPEAEPETVPLKLINAYDITVQTSLDDLVKIEDTPDEEPICISHNDAARSYPFTSGIDCLPNYKIISVVKTPGDVHLKNTDRSALSSYSDLTSKCGSSNPTQVCFDLNTNCSQGTSKHAISAPTTPPVVSIGTVPTDYEDAPVIVKKSTDVSGPVVAPSDHLSYQGNVLPCAVSQGVIDSRTTKNHLSFHGNVLPSAVSQGVGNARAYADKMTSCRNMPASTSPATSPPAMRARTGVGSYKDVPVIFKRSTDVPGPAVTSGNPFSYLGMPSAVSQGAVNTRTTKNHHSSQGILLPSAVSQGVVNTRTTKTHLSSQGIVLPSAVSQGVGNTRTTKNHLSSQGLVLPSAVSEEVGNQRTDADDMIFFRSMPAKECIPTSRFSGHVARNVCHESRKPVDACAPFSTDKEDSWCSKVQPSRSPASIGLAFMKLPGLERMEISSCNVKTGENKSINGQSMNTVRYQKEQLVSSTANVMQGQKNIGVSNSQSGKTVMDGYHPQQPTVRLMGKTVSVSKRSKDHSASNMGKVCSDNITIEATPLSAIPCQFPQKRSFPCQDFAIPRAHPNDSSNFVAKIPNNTFSGQKITFNGVHNQSLQPVNSISSTVKDCTWNFGSQFARQAEVNKAPMVNANSETRHVELHQQPHMTSIPRNQQSQFSTHASCRSGDGHNSVSLAKNESPSPQGFLKASMKEKYRKSTLLSYDDPSSAPIHQPHQRPGTKLPSASIISFFDHGSINSMSRNSSIGPCPSRTTTLADKSVVASGRTCTGNPTITDGRMGAGFANQINSRPACADNVSQQPAKRQLVTDRHDFTSTGPSMTNRSLGWSLDDAVGPRILDFRNRGAGEAAQISRNESNNSRATSGLVPPVETRWRGALVSEAIPRLKPGQNLNDHSKLLYPATFSVDNGVNSIVYSGKQERNNQMSSFKL
ncbi:hypothetical protein EJB05_17108, partial [Eragrostis curvula]